MKRIVLASLILVVMGLGMAAAWPPPDEPGGPPKKGSAPPPPPPRFELGRVMPPHFRDELELTEAQENELDDIERDVRQRVLKMLSADQRAKLHQLRRGRPAPPPGKPSDGRNGVAW